MEINVSWVVIMQFPAVSSRHGWDYVCNSPNQGCPPTVSSRHSNSLTRCFLHLLKIFYGGSLTKQHLQIMVNYRLTKQVLTIGYRWQHTYNFYRLTQHVCSLASSGAYFKHVHSDPHHSDHLQWRDCDSTFRDQHISFRDQMLIRFSHFHSTGMS